MLDPLAAVLRDFARNLTTDFSIQGILNELVLRVVEVLPVTAAGVTLISPGMAPHYVAASDEKALRFERLQTEVGEGPCLRAYQTGHAVLVPALALDDRFPEFGPPAVAAGLAAVFTFPLRQGDGRLGALDLYRDVEGPLAETDLAAAQTLADVAAAYLLTAQARQAADRYRHNSLHDWLTGLPNRMLLQERLDHAVQRARHSHRHTGAFFIDLDDFKRVNDEHGHDTGDAVLCAVADRLTSLARPGDTVARMHGDEFVMLCEDLPSAAAAESVATRIEDAFTAPFTVDTAPPRELAVRASVGLAYSGLGEDVSAELLVNADIAMYQAKRSGRRGRQVIDLRGAHSFSDGSTRRGDLEDAFAQDKLDLAYLPVVELPSGRITGVEALLRWGQPEGGPIPSHTMLDVAERQGMNSRVGDWALRRACTDRRRWLETHPELPLDVWISASRRQLMDAGFRRGMEQALDATETDPATVVLQVTDHAFADDMKRVTTVVGGLRDLGVRVAMNHFGVGQWSWSHLSRFPLDIVKLHGSLVADLGRVPTAGRVLEAVSDLAHTLGQQVAAAGVDTAAQNTEVSDSRCDHAQGSFFSRPVAAAAILDLLGAGTGALVTLPRTVMPAAGI